MTTRLNRTEVHDRIGALRRSLTGRETDWLMAISDLLDEDGRFPVRAALEAAEFLAANAQAGSEFRDLQHRVNEIAKSGGIDLRLELEAQETTPGGRLGWFTGDPIETGLVAFTEDAA